WTCVTRDGTEPENFPSRKTTRWSVPFSKTRRATRSPTLNGAEILMSMGNIVLIYGRLELTISCIQRIVVFGWCGKSVRVIPRPQPVQRFMRFKFSCFLIVTAYAVAESGESAACLSGSHAALETCVETARPPE